MRTTWLVFLFVGLLLVIPTIATVHFATSLWQTSNKLRSVVQSGIERTFLHNGIETGQDSNELYRLQRQLAAIAAPAHDAPPNARHLHVIAVENNRSIENGQASTGQAIKIDISRIGNWAALMIVEAPTDFTIEGATPAQRAKIAVEGDYPFSFNGPHKGLLSGFRIRSFGAIKTTSIRDLRRSSHREYHFRFCDALDRWIRHYDIELNDVLVWQLVGARQITIWQRQVSSKNKQIKLVGNAASLCNRF